MKLIRQTLNRNYRPRIFGYFVWVWKLPLLIKFNNENVEFDLVLSTPINFKMQKQTKEDLFVNADYLASF